MKKKGLLFIFTIFISLSINAQDDVILKNDGSEMHGKVIKTNKNDLLFVYKNEVIEYTVNKVKIAKITFSSGRIEFFNKKSPTTNLKLDEHHNKVAILPFAYIKNQETSNTIMTKKIQQESYIIFKKKSIKLKFQDPILTNALLAKSGVSNNNIDGYTMGEICNILNVEYIIQGLVSIEKSAMNNFSSTTTKSKNNKAYLDKKGHLISDVWKNNSKTSNTFNTSTQNYSTNITMNIYNDKGSNIFSKEHSSFWQTQNAYKITLMYLAKRTPIYKQ